MHCVSRVEHKDLRATQHMAGARPGTHGATQLSHTSDRVCDRSCSMHDPDNEIHLRREHAHGLPVIAASDRRLSRVHAPPAAATVRDEPGRLGAATRGRLRAGSHRFVATDKVQRQIAEETTESLRTYS